MQGAIRARTRTPDDLQLTGRPRIDLERAIAPKYLKRQALVPNPRVDEAGGRGALIGAIAAGAIIEGFVLIGAVKLRNFRAGAVLAASGLVMAGIGAALGAWTGSSIARGWAGPELIPGPAMTNADVVHKLGLGPDAARNMIDNPLEYFDEMQLLANAGGHDIKLSEVYTADTDGQQFESLKDALHWATARGGDTAIVRDADGDHVVVGAFAETEKHFEDVWSGAEPPMSPQYLGPRNVTLHDAVEAIVLDRGGVYLRS